MHPLERIARLLDGLNEWIGRTVAWLTLAMVFTTFGIVVARYAFEAGSIAVQESVVWMHGVVFLLGAAYTLKHDGHVRVDILYARLQPRAQAVIDLLGALLLLLPFMGFLLWVSWDYVATSWSLWEGSSETGGLAGLFLLKSTLLVFPLLLILQGLSQAARSLLILLGHPEAAAQHDAPREI